MASNPKQGEPNRNNNPQHNKNNKNPNQNNNKNVSRNKQNQNRFNTNVKKDQHADGFVVVPDNKPGPSKQQNQQKAVPNVNSSKVLNEVLSVLECPVCLEFLQAPIFMCESGHNICGQCRMKLCIPVCPICKNGVTGQRNYDVEKIAAAMAVPCANSTYGCRYIGSPDSVKTHFEDCRFRQYFCPIGREFNKCSWNGPLSQLSVHFGEAHPNNMKLKPGCQVLFDNFVTNQMDEDIQLVTVGKFAFLYHVKIDPKKNLAFWGVQYLGPSKDASKHKYEFNIYNSKKPKKVMTVSDECESDDLTFQRIYDSGNCVAIPLHVLNNFIHDNKKFTFKFFIRLGDRPKTDRNPKTENKIDINLFAEKLSLM